MMDYETAKAELAKLEALQLELPSLIKQAAQSGHYASVKALRQQQAEIDLDIMGAKETVLVAQIAQDEASCKALTPQKHQVKQERESLIAQRKQLEKQITAAGEKLTGLNTKFFQLERRRRKAEKQLEQLRKERMMQASGEQSPKTVDFLSPEAWGLGKAAGHIKLRPPLFAGAIPGYIPLGQSEQIATAAIKERRKLGPLSRPARTS